MSAISSSRFSFALVLATALMTPAGAGLFGPSTPQEKLDDALYLASGPGRIAAARKEIEEVRAECEKSGDKACLSEVYRLYGLLERSGAKTGDIIMFGGINAKDPTPENIDRSEPYFVKAMELATEAQAFDKVVNINFLEVVNQKYRGTPLGGCVYLDRMVSAAQKAQDQNPDKKFNIPPQFKTPAEWVAAIKQQLGCPAN